MTTSTGGAPAWPRTSLWVWLAYEMDRQSRIAANPWEHLPPVQKWRQEPTVEAALDAYAGIGDTWNGDDVLIEELSAELRPEVALDRLARAAAEGSDGEAVLNLDRWVSATIRRLPRYERLALNLVFDVLEPHYQVLDDVLADVFPEIVGEVAELYCDGDVQIAQEIAAMCILACGKIRAAATRSDVTEAFWEEATEGRRSDVAPLAVIAEAMARKAAQPVEERADEVIESYCARFAVDRADAVRPYSRHRSQLAKALENEGVPRSVGQTKLGVKSRQAYAQLLQ